MSFKRILGAVTASMAIVLAASGCGSSTDDKGASGNTRSVEHFFGTSKVPETPKRVVTVGYTDDQTVLSLGIKPVGMTDQYPNTGNQKPDINTQWPWVKDLWGTDTPAVVMTNGDSGPDVEKIASLKPDLIIAVYSDIDEDTYKRLNAIAPTVARNKSEAKAFAGTWRETIEQIARAIGKEEQAKAKLAEIDALNTKLRTANPQFAQQTAAAVSWYKNQVYPFANTDVRGQIMQGLGFKPAPELDALSGGKFSFPLSSERLNAIDVGRLLVINDPEDQNAIKALPAFAALKVVQSGQVSYLNDSDAPSIGAALSQATLPAMPYAIEGVVKAVNGA
ncbi:iron-siderophore ABC transporter substrate-binding protein [Tsukamurella serpentis]